MKHTATLAYIIGAALGDGNVSRPNGRATRLRITCDNSYPKIITEITHALKQTFPENKVTCHSVKSNTHCNISVYSNKLDACLPWNVGAGSKFAQRARVPLWIMSHTKYVRACLKGLIQTDGSIYTDRGYLMVNFSNNTKELAEDVLLLMQNINYAPRLYKSTNPSGTKKYTVRLSKNTAAFIEEINVTKE